VHHHWKLHCSCRSWLNTSKHMQGDRWLRTLLQPCVTFLIAQYFNNKEMFTYLLMALGKQIITVKAMARLATFSNFSRGQLLVCRQLEGAAVLAECCGCPPPPPYWRKRRSVLSSWMEVEEPVWCMLPAACVHERTSPPRRWLLAGVMQRQCGGVRRDLQQRAAPGILLTAWAHGMRAT
jgi:hypothetical protein